MMKFLIIFVLVFLVSATVAFSNGVSEVMESLRLLERVVLGFMVGIFCCAGLLMIAKVFEKTRKIYYLIGIIGLICIFLVPFLFIVFKV